MLHASLLRLAPLFHLCYHRRRSLALKHLTLIHLTLNRVTLKHLSLRSRLRWLAPGLGVKRWIALLLLGTTLVGLGLGYVLLDLYRTANLPSVVSLLTLQFI